MTLMNYSEMTYHWIDHLHKWIGQELGLNRENQTVQDIALNITVSLSPESGLNFQV
jgi:hypothetical protein